MILSVIYFLLIFLGVVVVHEFGHFIFAKIFGVYVTEFSVGFGPKIFSKKGKETEYMIKAIPLGGYVRMAGDDPTVDSVEGISKDRLLYSKTAWKRFIIVFAGPLFSILAGYAMMILLSVGWGFPQANVDWVIPNSPAAIAGIRAGDRIVSINGKAVLSPTEVSSFIKGQDSVKLRYERDGKIFTADVVPTESLPQYFIVTNGKIPEGATLLRVDGIKFDNTQLTAGSTLYFSNGATATLYGYTMEPGSKAIGIYISTLSNKVAGVDETTGLKPGDRILSVDGVNSNGSLQLQNAFEAGTYGKGTGTFAVMDGNRVVQSNPYNASNGVVLSVSRGGKSFSLNLGRAKFDSLVKSLVLHPGYGNWYPKSTLDAVWYSVVRTDRIFSEMVAFIPTLFSNRNAISEIAGPVGMVQLVGQASQEGMQMVIFLVAILTLNLGIINLLPFPALDGGHLVFALIEMIARKRIKPEIEGYIHTVGFLILMVFLVYITFQDVTRFFG